MSAISNQINEQSLNGIITLSDGVLNIENGVISAVDKIETTELNSDIVIANTANVGTLDVGNLNVNKLNAGNVLSNQVYSTNSAGYSLTTSYLNSLLLRTNDSIIKNCSINSANIINGIIQDANIISLETIIMNCTGASIRALDIIDTFNLIPAGTIQMTVINSISPPDGWLYCRGQQVSKTIYNRLWLAIGDTYGDFGVNFGLPNFQGCFLRGFNSTGSAISGYNTGNIGSYQIDQMRQHTHSLTIRNPSTVQSVQSGINNAADNSTVTRDTSTGTDNRGFALGTETVPYHSMVNYLIKY